MRPAIPIAFAVLLLGLSTSAQDLSIDVNLRLLDVFVEDLNGRAVLGLSAEDFEIVDDGVEKPVKHLDLEAGPVAAVIVLDRSSSIRPIKDRMDEDVASILNAVRPDDQLSLRTFAGTNQLNVKLTTEHKTVAEAFRKAKFGYGSRVYDAILDSLSYLSTSSLERRILIVFTDGADHYSTLSFEQLLDNASLYGIPIYLVGYIGDDSRTFSDAGRLQIQTQFAELAQATDGQVFFPLDTTDRSAIALQILDRARYTYRLGFYSSAPISEFSDVSVKVRGDGRRKVIVRRPQPVAVNL